ncbi:MAG: MMPL family transporter, partial [Solirubrobacteraceae bacterium]
MKKLATWCFTNKRTVIVAWVIAAVGLIAIESSTGSAYSNNFTLPNTGSFNAIKLLQHNAPKVSGDSDQIVISSTAGKLTDPAVRTRVQALLAKVATLPDVGGVASPYVIKKQIAPGGTIGFATVT